MAGAPSKLTPEVSAKIIHLLEEGWFFRHALAEVGVAEATGHRWIEQGGEEDASDLLRGFREGCARARSRAERTLLASIERKSEATERALNPADWKADAWLLERHNPSAYKDTKRTEITGADGGAVQVSGLAEFLATGFDDDNASKPSQGDPEV